MGDFRHLLTIAGLLLVLPVGAVAADDPDQGAVCRELQRTAHEAAATGGSQGRSNVIQALQDARKTTNTKLKDCLGCILNQFAENDVIGDDEPCGTHDVCVAGYPLETAGGDCIASVCASSSTCCTHEWTASCVSLAELLCNEPCGQCLHDECVEGRALPSDCTGCTTLVCSTDPYCCDTVWDDRCVAQAIATCNLNCGATTTTTTTSTSTSTTATNAPTTTTSTTSTSMPECIDDIECDDGKPCTDDVCAAGVCTNTIDNANLCSDGNLCTVGDKCLNGSCIGGPIRNCNDSDACTIDFCQPADGQCGHQARTCSDGNACTTDSCDSISGCLNDPIDCDDNDPCTEDTCGIVVGCRNTPIPDCIP